MWFKQHRRELLLAQAYPEGWESIIARNLAHYARLSPAEQQRLRNDTRVVVAEKNWEGCRGLQLTEEIKVTIAAQACLMLLGLAHDYFRRVLSILVYPSLFRLPGDEWQDEGETQILAGQAVYRGPVILAWDRVLSEGRDPSCGNNVVIHEFAHQLDFLDDSINGTPDLGGDEQAKQWRAVMTREFAHLKREVQENRETFLGEYASRNETEFFAVASERFFTMPLQLRHFHPLLYELLVKYYGVESVNWFSKNK